MENFVEYGANQRNIGEQDPSPFCRPAADQCRRRLGTPETGLDLRGCDQYDAATPGTLLERSEFRDLRNQAGVGVERMKTNLTLVQQALRSRRGWDHNLRIRVRPAWVHWWIHAHGKIRADGNGCK